MSSSSESRRSPSPIPLDEEPVYPHIRPLAHPISREDQEIYSALTSFHEDLLRISSTADEEVSPFLLRWNSLRERTTWLLHQNALSQDTINLYDTVLELTEALLELYIEHDNRLQTVCNDLSVQLEGILAEGGVTRPVKTKKDRSTPPTQPSIPHHNKPILQTRRAPSKNSKTTRKRRIESGVPGQESLKFRPCRDFFMAHLSDPYPTPAQKADLMRAAGISDHSVTQWFTNTRRRSKWMDIMKEHANGRKEDMRVLVEAALAPSNPNFPISAEARDAVFKMKKYVDELAREVVSKDFMAALAELQAMTEADAQQWQEQQRQARKKKTQIKREDSTPSLYDEESSSPAPEAGVGEKRKRQPGSEDLPLAKIQRQAGGSAQPRPIRPYVNTQRAQSRSPSGPQSSSPSSSSRPSSSTQDSPDARTHSPLKRVYSLTDTEDEQPEPPRNLHRRRLGVPDLTAPLSASSTFIGSDVTDTSSSQYSDSSPIPYTRSHSTSLRRLSTEIDLSGQIDPVIVVNVPLANAGVDPTEFSFDSNSMDLFQPIPPAAGSSKTSCNEWLRSLGGQFLEPDAPISFWDGLHHALLDPHPSSDDVMMNDEPMLDTAPLLPPAIPPPASRPPTRPQTRPDQAFSQYPEQSHDFATQQSSDYQSHQTIASPSSYEPLPPLSRRNAFVYHPTTDMGMTCPPRAVYRTKSMPEHCIQPPRTISFAS